MESENNTYIIKLLKKRLFKNRNLQGYFELLNQVDRSFVCMQMFFCNIVLEGKVPDVAQYRTFLIAAFKWQMLIMVIRKVKALFVNHPCTTSKRFKLSQSKI